MSPRYAPGAGQPQYPAAMDAMGGGEFDDIIVPSMRHPRRTGDYSAVGRYAMQNFPEKTFIISRRADLRKLRAI